MSRELQLSIGQHSDKGRKDVNQDFHGALIPKDQQLRTKGVAIVLADGISSSQVSSIASESAVKSFLMDYYCTSESWSVKTSGQRVIVATNSWLHAQNRQSQYHYDRDKGYVCTLSALVIKSTTAHIFHVGDSRVYQVAGNGLEQLTNDHRVVISSEQSYLGRALGVTPQIEIDYRMMPVAQGDVFVLVTDGVYEYAGARLIANLISANAGDLDQAAKLIIEEALRQGSPDNLTVQIARVDALPDAEASEILGQSAQLPLPPLLESRTIFDGYRIIREIHGSSRSHIYLGQEIADETLVAIKIPSIDLRDDAAYLRRFMMEEWVARRINSANVLKPCSQLKKRNFLYVVTEFVEGQTLRQWMIDNPRSDLETTRGIVEQIAAGLRAFHRMEMLHQDIRPDNIMIDRTGTVKIIDFGSTKVAGVVESTPLPRADEILGTAQYAAPEYFLGENGSPRSDLFSLGVIAYQMLTGKLPYGAEVAKARTKAQQRKLKYKSACEESPDLPAWVDEAIRRAVHPDPQKRYEEISEFLYELRHPSDSLARTPPLAERNPLLFWKVVAATLGGLVVLLLAKLCGAR